MTAPIDQPTLTLSRTQQQFVADEHPYAAFVGGIGSGKSFAGAAKALVQYLGRPCLGLVIAPTFGVLRDSTWRTCLELWAPLVREVNRGEMRIVLRTGAEALFRSADDPDRLRGPNASWAWIDEGAQCDPETWPITIGRLRQGGQPGRAWTTTTPRGFNWVHEVFVARADASTALYRATTRSNPFVGSSFTTSLEGQYSAAFAAQELEGQFVNLSAGLIRREWFRIVEHAPAGLTWSRYWDLATSTRTTADFTASVRAALGDDGTLYIADMIRGRWAWPEARRIIVQTIASEPDVEVGVESVGFQLAAFQDILADPSTVGRVVRSIGVDRDKLSRAQPWIARAEAGRVALVRGPWISEFLAEAEAFGPDAPHDDQVDSVSGAVAMLAHRPQPAASAMVDPTPDTYRAERRSVTARADSRYRISRVF
jgi:predicted phage terminase large subunit-like protein